MPLLQRSSENPAIRQAQSHVLGAEVESPHDVQRRRHDLGVRGRGGLSDDVHVELKMLLEPAPLLPLVAEQLRNREPAERLLQRLGARSHHPGQRRRHFWPQGHRPSALVGERVQLLHDFLAALLRVQLLRLQRGPIVLLEAIAPRDLAPCGEDVVAEG